MKSFRELEYRTAKVQHEEVLKQGHLEYGLQHQQEEHEVRHRVGTHLCVRVTDFETRKRMVPSCEENIREDSSRSIMQMLKVCNFLVNNYCELELIHT